MLDRTLNLSTSNPIVRRDESTDGQTAETTRGPRNGFDPESLTPNQQIVKSNVSDPGNFEDVFDLKLSHTGTANITRSNHVDATNDNGKTLVSDSGDVVLSNRSRPNRAGIVGESLAEYSNRVQISSEGGRGIARHNNTVFLTGKSATLTGEDNAEVRVGGLTGRLKGLLQNNIVELMANGKVYLGGLGNRYILKDNLEVTFGDRSTVDGKAEETSNAQVTYFGSAGKDKLIITAAAGGKNNIFTGENGDYASMGSGDDTAYFDFINKDSLKGFENSQFRLTGGKGNDTIGIQLSNDKIQKNQYNVYYKDAGGNWVQQTVNNGDDLYRLITQTNKEVRIEDTVLKTTLDYQLTSGSKPDKTRNDDGFERVEIYVG